MLPNSNLQITLQSLGSKSIIEFFPVRDHYSFVCVYVDLPCCLPRGADDFMIFAAVRNEDHWATQELRQQQKAFIRDPQGAGKNHRAALCRR